MELLHDRPVPKIKLLRLLWLWQYFSRLDAFLSPNQHYSTEERMMLLCTTGTQNNTQHLLLHGGSHLSV